MLYNTLHNRWLRLLVAVIGMLFVAVSLKLFIVPMNLYAGSLTGACQLASTLLNMSGITRPGQDVTGIILFFLNSALLLLAYRQLGRKLVFKTVLCTTSFSLFYSLIPSPAVPIVTDYWTACLLGGCLSGIGYGIVLTCGSSGGGLDIVGLYINKRNIPLSVGRVNLIFNIALYAICLILFNAEIVIYSVIFNFFTSVMQDRTHHQSINVQALIFSRTGAEEIGTFIMEKLHRGVTYLEGVGGYTGAPIRVLCVYMSKYEVDELLHVVREIDPQAFITVQENSHIYGNFKRNLS